MVTFLTDFRTLRYYSSGSQRLRCMWNSWALGLCWGHLLWLCPFKDVCPAGEGCQGRLLCPLFFHVLTCYHCASTNRLHLLLLRCNLFFNNIKSVNIFQKFLVYSYLYHLCRAVPVFSIHPRLWSSSISLMYNFF